MLVKRILSDAQLHVAAAALAALGIQVRERHPLAVRHYGAVADDVGLSRAVELHRLVGSFVAQVVVVAVAAGDSHGRQRQQLVGGLYGGREYYLAVAAQVELRDVDIHRHEELVVVVRDGDLAYPGTAVEYLDTASALGLYARRRGGQQREQA